MSSNNFDIAVEIILKHEGGYVDHPDDPGGETNYGISKRAYPDVDIANLTREGATAIYKRDYWDRISGDDLPFAVGIVVVDYAVNSGVSRASKALQLAAKTTADGVVGPMTVEAVRACSEQYLVNQVTHHRQQFVRNLLTYGTFGKGWERRIEETHNFAMELI
jgi:lysozyme family protein